MVVAYRSGGRADGLASGQGGTVTMRFTGQSRRIRIDSADGRGYVVVDTDANRMTVVNLDHHSFTDQPVDANIMATFQTTNVTYRTAGTDTVAGIPCTNYDVTVDGQAGQRCLTADGVLLRARGAGHDPSRELEAVKVTYGDQPAFLFDVPAPDPSASSHRTGPMIPMGPMDTPRGSTWGPGAAR